MTDDAKAMREQLEAVSGERISALEGVGAMEREASAKVGDAERADQRVPGRDGEPPAQESGPMREGEGDVARIDRRISVEKDLGL